MQFIFNVQDLTRAEQIPPELIINTYSLFASSKDFQDSENGFQKKHNPWN